MHFTQPNPGRVGLSRIPPVVPQEKTEDKSAQSHADNGVYGGPRHSPASRPVPQIMQTHRAFLVG